MTKMFDGTSAATSSYNGSSVPPEDENQLESALEKVQEHLEV
jgi:hypothetical protein